MKLSVVIPALNEEGIVEETVRSIPLEKLNDMGFKTEIIVDNASTDKTAEEEGNCANRLFKEILWKTLHSCSQHTMKKNL